VLKIWRARREQPRNEGTTAPAPSGSVMTPAGVLAGELDRTRLDLDRVAMLEEQLKERRRELSDWAEDIEPVDATDNALLLRIDGLRNLLEAVYGQRITFTGERREPSGTPVILGTVTVEDLAGNAAGVRAEIITSGEVHGEVRARRVGQGAEAIGVNASIIGGPRRTDASHTSRPNHESDENDPK
jgi:hypothetical protein